MNKLTIQSLLLILRSSLKPALVSYSILCLAVAASCEDDFLSDSEGIYETRPQLLKERTSQIGRASAKQNKISLDLKGMDIVDVLKMISQRAGFNIIIGKNVTGKVTIFLKDVDIWDAFEIILASNNLAYDIKGDIIYIMSDRDYELSYGEKFGSKRQFLTKRLEYAKAQELNKTLSQIKSSVGSVIIDENTNTVVVFDTQDRIRQIESLIEELDKPVKTKIFELKYAQADKISPKIQEEISKGVGSIRIDERTNKIAVTDYPHKIEGIGKIIEAFDEKPQQVRIDAQIIEITPEKDEFKMGVDWDAWISKNLRLANSLSMGNATKLSLGMATASLALGEKYDKKGVLDMLRTIGKTKILSSPSITALNNQEAKILVGTKEAYITSTTSQSGSGTTEVSQTVNFVDVGVKLYVTPTISRDGYVTMKIKPEVSSAKMTDLTSEGKVTQVPIVTTSEAETTITLKDRTTLVIAGLKKDQKQNETKKIPFLGDIPILGIPFRSVNTSLTKNELVVFLTPSIISESNPAKYTSLTADKDILAALNKAENQQDILFKEKKRAKAKNILSGKKETPTLRNLLSLSDDNDYYGYVRDKISAIVNIMNTDIRQKGEVLVSFVLLSNGKLSGEPLIVSSTSEELREPTIKVIKSASPFPPFPSYIHKTKEKFQLSILYNN